MIGNCRQDDDMRSVDGGSDISEGGQLNLISPKFP